MMDSVMTLREAVRCGKSRPLALQPAVGTLTMRASGAGVSGGGRATAARSTSLAPSSVGQALVRTSAAERRETAPSAIAVAARRASGAARGQRRRVGAQWKASSPPAWRRRRVALIFRPRSARLASRRSLWLAGARASQSRPGEGPLFLPRASPSAEPVRLKGTPHRSWRFQHGFTPEEP